MKNLNSIFITKTICSVKKKICHLTKHGISSTVILSAIFSILLSVTSCSKEEEAKIHKADLVDKTNEVTSKESLIVLETEEIWTYEDFKKECLSQFEYTESFNSEELQQRETLMDQQFKGDYTPLVSLKVKYLSKDPFGNDIYLSGKIYVRLDLYYIQDKVAGIILANHYTITADKECPSNALMYEGMFATFGYAVVMSDYYGFGITNDKPQTYLHESSTAQACVDFFLVAKDYLEKSKRVKVGDNHYNLGYSQGAATTIAVQKLVEAKYADKIQFRRTFAGGGPYDIEGTYNDLIITNKTGIPAAIPLIITGMDYSEKLNLDYKTIFQEPLLSGYADWIFSKKYTTSDISKKMGTKQVNEILHPNALNANDPQTAKLLTALRKNSLISGWNPSQKSPITLFHSTTDDVVPCLNTNNLLKSFISNGNYPNTYISDYGGHTKAALYFFAKCADDIEWFFKP